MIRGDAMKGIEAMRQLKDTLHKLADLPMKLAAEAKPGIDRQLQEEFRNGTGPYGRPWAPVSPVTLRLRKKSRSPIPLTDTAAMRDGTVAQTVPGRRGLRIVVGQPYGYFHQVGTRHMVARKILPEYGLPAAWKVVLREAAQRLAREAVRRG